MNTKTDVISSELVAVAWLAPSNYEWPSHFFSMTEIRNGEPLVRLSDAEAIINDLQTLVIAENQRKQQLEQEVAAKAAEIERLIQFATLTDGGFNERMQTISQQAERIKELEAEDSVIHHLKDETIVAQGGEIAKQSAALKLASAALGEVQDLIGESHGVYGLHLNGDESPWGELEQGGRFERLTLLNEALAAIDALGE